MAEALAASGGSSSNAAVEVCPATQEIPALGPEFLNSGSTSKTLPYSPRIAAMKQNRESYSDQVEFDIASSKVHWSALEDEKESEDSEKHVALLKANREAFENLKRHPCWGRFFSRDSIRVGGQVGKQIAEGAQAKIYECPDSRLFVLKVFKRGSLLQDLQKQWPQTVFADKDTGPQGVLICQGHLLDDGRFAFVMRKFWGDLRRLMDLRMLENENSGPPFQFGEYLTLMDTVALQMLNLHARGICHKDLKAANILVTEGAVREPSIGRIQIADYECSIGVLGTTFWRAPEILLAERNYVSAIRNKIEPPPIPFSKAADVYSYGMLLYEVLTGLVPFEREGFYDKPSDENYDRVIGGVRPELPDDMDWRLKDLIRNCWHEDEERRPTFKQIRIKISSTKPNSSRSLPQLQIASIWQDPHIKNRSSSFWWLHAGREDRIVGTKRTKSFCARGDSCYWCRYL